MPDGANQAVILQILSILLTICLIPLIKWLIGREVKRFEERDAENKKQLEDLKCQVNQKFDKIKDDMNDMKNDMPFIYTTREDFIRSIDSVERTTATTGQTVNKIYELISRKGD